MVNTFEKPDFAFPKTVEKNAGAKLSSALQQEEYGKAILASIQLNVAETLVDKDSFPQSIERYELISQKAPAPWNALASLLEARLYSEVYLADSWNYRNRELPDNPVPQNVLEWNSRMFSRKVSELVERALRQSANLNATPLTAASEVLVDIGQAVKMGMTLEDFIVFKSIELINIFDFERQTNTIPFGLEKPVAESDKSKLSQENLIDKTIAAHASDEDKGFLAYLYLQKLDLTDSSEYDSCLDKCRDIFCDTPYYAPFLVRICRRTKPENMDMNDWRRNNLRLLDDYVSRYPDAPGINEVKNAAAELKRPSVELHYTGQILPDQELNVKILGYNRYNFNILVVKVKENPDNENFMSMGEILTGSVVKCIPFHVGGSVPDRYVESVKISALKPGRYALLVSSDETLKGVTDVSPKQQLQTFKVSELSFISMNTCNKQQLLYIVSGHNQRPVEGATVKLYTQSYRKKELAGEYVTDENGLISFLPAAADYKFVATKDGNRIAGDIYRAGSWPPDRKITRAKILTDLTLYRPGDKVQGSVIVYSEEDDVLAPVPDRSIKLKLMDANWQEVDTVRVTTDKFGRSGFSLAIPPSGLLGEWTIVCEDKTFDSNRSGSQLIHVEEYKMPTFFVDVKAAADSLSTGNMLTFKGRAMTYAGMPVSGAKVSFHIESVPSWWRSDAPDGSYGGVLETQADGTFEIALNTQGVKDTPFARNAYRLNVDVTDAAGETRQAPVVRFSIGEGLTIVPVLPDRIDGDNLNQDFTVSVLNLADVQENKTVYYRISSGDKILDSGSFKSPCFSPDLKKLPSGKYEFLFSLDSEYKESDLCKTSKDSVIIWRSSDKRPPFSSIIWVPRNEIIAPADSKEVEVKVGTTCDDSYVLASISNKDGLIRNEWLHVSDGFATVSVPVPADNDRVFVTFSGIDNLKFEESSVTVIPEKQRQQLIIKTESFRDKVVPGGKEQWKFKFILNDQEMRDIPAFAVLTDKALNSIYPFAWNLNPAGSLSWRNPISLSQDYIRNGFFTFGESVKYLPVNGQGFEIPSFRTYGHSLYSRQIHIRGSRMYKSMAYATGGSDAIVTTEGSDDADGMVLREPSVMMNAMADMGAKKESYPEAETSSQYEQTASEPSSGSVNLRQTSMPLGFFFPDLATDKEGNLELSFTAPEFIGTWQLQVAGYTDDLKGAVLTRDAVSSKPLMVKLNAPRFVRTADKVSIAATAFNNSNDELTAEIRIEAVNPFDGSVIASETRNLSGIKSLSSEVITVTFTVPEGLSEVVIRVIADSDKFKDGEQTAVPVLPSSTIVRESSPFYIGNGKQSFELRLPEMNREAQVTLMYCDNPVWECVTALPSLTVPESESVYVQSKALFGIAVSAGLFEKYPELKTYILSLDSSDQMKSPLEKYSSLKNVELNNTPWVNNALSESLRMASLTRYADSEQAKKAINDMMGILQKRQNYDGGWGWCPDMPSSQFMTERVLSIFANLKNLGFLPEGSEGILKKAFGYMDVSLADDWNRTNRKYYSRRTLLDYLWAKSCFPEIESKTTFRALEAKAMKDITNNWKGLNVAEKATAAMLLARRDNGRLANLILESLRQYASENEQKGMWFANLQADWSALPPLLTTARVLEAYALISPANPAVDKLRQWMVLSKQTQDWGGSNEGAEAIAAILSSGTDWTATGQNPEIRLNGELLKLPYGYSGTGAFLLDLEADKASSAELSIERDSASPAWGGVLATYQKPIREVAALAVPQLSVEKNIYSISRYGADVKVSADSLNVGDRVRVTLTIVSDRNLDYVTVTDPRPACLEPADQISGYTFSDGIGMYREVRNESTNLFIPYLPKGTHVISYDCFVDRTGEYANGIVAAQSQYAPLITASGSGEEVIVRE